MKSLLTVLLCGVLLVCAAEAFAQTENPRHPNWQTYHSTADAYALLEGWTAAFPNLTSLYAIGETLEGTPLLVLEITNKETGEALEKPGYYYDGNIHAEELAGAEVALHFAWHVLSHYGEDPRTGTPEQEGSTMRTKKILRNTGLLAASGVVALALAAVPAAPGLDAGFLGLKAAQAKGNGGSGNGNGNAGGNGNANGHGKGADVSGATLDAHGKSTGGHAKGKGNGHSTGLSTEGSHLGAENHGLTASAMAGLNASHASIQGFAHASDNSMVGQIGLAVEVAYDGIATEGTISTIDPDEVDDPTLEEALADILGVGELEDGVLDAVKGLVDDKVEVPD